MPKERVACFVDGFNLYHAIESLNKNHLKWVDLWALAEVFVRPQSQFLDSVYYFSAYAYWLPDKAKRHREFVKALVAKGITPVMANFKEKDRVCRNCRHKWKGHEEKETDVNIALALLNSAYQDEYEHALLISRDSDLAPAVRMVSALFPAKPITVIAPPHRGHSAELLAATPLKAKIRVEHIERCLLPEKVHDPGGNIAATRPREYDPPS